MTRRLLISYLGLALVIVAALVVPLGITYATSQQRDLVSRVERDAFTMASIGHDSFPRPTAAEQRRLWATAVRYQAETGGRVILVDERARLIADSEAPPARQRDFSDDPEVSQALTGMVASGERKGADGEDEIRVAVPVSGGGATLGAVRIGVPDSELDKVVREFWLILGLIAAVMMAAVAVLGLVLARSVGRPLKRLRAVAAAIGGGDLSSRTVSIEGPTEVRALAASFDGMADQVENMVETQRGFAADASHQLRTPLAAILLRLDNALHDLNGSPARKDVAAAFAEAERLNRMVTGLLVLSRTEQSTRDPVVVDVMDVIGDRIGVHGELARQERIVLRGDCGPLSAYAQPGALEQILDNLVENAIKASPPESEVVVRGALIDGSAEIHVVDSGPGMSEDERSRAFERFWSSRESRAGGTGLGLAIVRRLTVACGGTIELRDAPGGGLDAVVRLTPAAGAPAELAAETEPAVAVTSPP